VTTLELFFDLVFAFTLTQLGTLLASGFTAAGAGRVLLIFGLLWWMYEGYAWLTNARPPVHPAERLLLLVGMAGFLTIGLAIPDGFGGSSLALGLGYLAVVIVHAVLCYRVNQNIVRIAPFNVAAAAIAVGAALFLAGEAVVRRLLRTGPWRHRAVAAVVVLATMPIGVFVALEVQIVVVTVLLVVMLVLESNRTPGRGSARFAG
jgi:low temperature requirement protein LtrA